MKNLIIALILILALAVGGGALWFLDFIYSPDSAENKQIIFAVAPGTSISSISFQLEQQFIIKNARLFSLYSRLSRKAGSIKVGEYALSASMSPNEILEVLTSGKSVTYPITFQEGLNMYDMATLLETKGLAKKNEFLALCKNKEFILELLGEEHSTLEGYLFPNTYLFSHFTGTKNIIREMVRQFLHVFAQIKQGPRLVPMKEHEAVILASIIEKETGVPEERGLVSSVFHNRIKKGMRLQTDPTIIYGILDLTGATPLNIHRSDLTNPTRYNTYVLSGLPYGPISNPGKEALFYAFNPTTSDYLYFVSRNDGTHVFSSTYEQHNRAVKHFQLDSKQREGKSWRNLSKDRR